MSKNGRSVIEKIVTQLKKIDCIEAIVLSGSRAYVQNVSNKVDYDIGILYFEKLPFDMDTFKSLVFRLSDYTNPYISKLDADGPLRNGSAFISIQGLKINFLYTNVNFLERVIKLHKKGLFESDYASFIPYGIHSYNYCAFIQKWEALYDPRNITDRLRNQIGVYPQLLKRNVVNSFIFRSQRALDAARDAYSRKQLYILIGSLTKSISSMIQVLYALNETYPTLDKNFSHDYIKFQMTLPHFLKEINTVLSIKDDKKSMLASLKLASSLHAKVINLSKSIYTSQLFNSIWGVWA